MAARPEPLVKPERIAPPTPSPTSLNPPRGSLSPSALNPSSPFDQNSAPNGDSTPALRPAQRPPSFSRRRVKSPEVAETTFTMSTIEEEMEGVSIRQENEP